MFLRIPVFIQDEIYDVLSPSSVNYVNHKKMNLYCGIYYLNKFKPELKINDWIMTF